MISCPAEQTLFDYLDDKLVHEEITEVETHVQSCQSCQQDLQRLSGDEVASHWRKLADRAALSPSNFPPLADTVCADQSRFAVIRLLGEGGQGKVYVAHDMELNREVALKVMKSDLGWPKEARARFLAEAEITGKLEHPGIVPVYGLGARPDGTPFYATRVVEGESLAAEIKKLHALPKEPAEEHSLALRRLLAAFVSVCNTMAYAHSRGVLHRDLKPANIMIGRYGETFVLDWGLAKWIGEAEHEPETDTTTKTLPVSPPREGVQTVAGSLFGTPRYMSPEQASGQTGAVRQASDIYSLGATLYCVLTGAPPVIPFERDDTAGAAPLPRQIDQRVDPALGAICLKAMAGKPKNRYPTPADLAKDIERWLADEPVEVYTEPFRRRAERWVRKHRMGVSTALLILLLVGSMSAAGILVEGARKRADELKTLKEKAEVAAADAVQQKAEADRQRLRADRLRYASDMNMAHVAWQDGRIALGLELLERHRPNEIGAIDRREFEWFYLWGLTHSESITLAGHKKAGHKKVVTCVAFSPDGQLLASGSFDNTVILWDVGTGKEVHTFSKARGAVRSVAFSASGRLLAVGGDDCMVELWDLNTYKKTATLEGHQHSVHGVCFSSDGSRLASGSRDGTIRVWDLVGNMPPVTLDAQAAVMSVCFSPDGTRLASAGHGPEPKIWDWAKGKEIFRLKKHGGYIFAICFSADGKRIATGSQDNTAKIWDAEDGTELWTIREHKNTVTNVRFSPDSTLLATTSVDQTAKIWNVVTGAKQVELRGHTAMIWGLSFHGDGNRLATGSDDGTAKIWDLRLPAKQAPLVRNSHAITDCYCLAGSHRLASADAGGFARIWDTRQKKEVHAWEAHPGCKLLKLSATRDGRYLASAAEDGAVKIRDLGDNKETGGWSAHSRGQTCLGLSPDGTRLVTAGADAKVKVWNVQTGQPLWTGSEHASGVHCVEFRNDGRLLASGGEDVTIKIWAAETGKLLASMREHTHPVFCLRFSPDNRYLASASDDQTVKIWDCATWTSIVTLKGHTNFVLSLSFSPDGSRLASACHDGTVKVWDLGTEHELLTIKAGSSPMNAVSFSSDGSYLAAGSGDGTIHVWEGRNSKNEITPKAP